MSVSVSWNADFTLLPVREADENSISFSFSASKLMIFILWSFLSRHRAIESVHRALLVLFAQLAAVTFLCTVFL